MPGEFAGLRRPLQAGDTVVEINGKPVTRQAQLKQELNRFYAGDNVHLVVLRGEQRVEQDIELVDKLQPYEFPFLGILPRRPVGGEPQGLIVRYVYPGSPAAGAGLQSGDRITSLGGSEIKDATAAAERLRSLQPDAKTAIAWERDGKPSTAEIVLGRLPADPPAELPPAHGAVKAAEGVLPALGVVEIKIPEVKNDCIAYVPPDYNPAVAYGVVIWLHAPGGDKQDELLARWRDQCQKNDLILLAPKTPIPPAGSRAKPSSSSRRWPRSSRRTTSIAAGSSSTARKGRLARLPGGLCRHGSHPRDCPGRVRNAAAGRRARQRPAPPAGLPDRHGQQEPLCAGAGSGHQEAPRGEIPRRGPRSGRAARAT